jgi:hypothetical protein
MVAGGGGITGGGEKEGESMADGGEETNLEKMVSCQLCTLISSCSDHEIEIYL